MQASSGDSLSVPNVRPQQTFVTILKDLLEGQELSLSQIYEAVQSKYPFFEASQPGWKNTVRHTLSLNPAFQNVPRPHPALGKGGLWRIDPEAPEHFTRKRDKKKKATPAVAPASPSSSPETDADRDPKRSKQTGRTRGASAGPSFHATSHSRPNSRSGGRRQVDEDRPSDDDDEGEWDREKDRRLPPGPVPVPMAQTSASMDRREDLVPSSGQPRERDQPERGPEKGRRPGLEVTSSSSSYTGGEGSSASYNLPQMARPDAAPHQHRYTGFGPGPEGSYRSGQGESSSGSGSSSAWSAYQSGPPSGYSSSNPGRYAGPSYPSYEYPESSSGYASGSSSMYDPHPAYRREGPGASSLPYGPPGGYIPPYHQPHPHPYSNQPPQPWPTSAYYAHHQPNPPPPHVTASSNSFFPHPPPTMAQPPGPGPSSYGQPPRVSYSNPTFASQPYPPAPPPTQGENPPPPAVQLPPIQHLELSGRPAGGHLHVAYTYHDFRQPALSPIPPTPYQGGGGGAGQGERRRSPVHLGGDPQQPPQSGGASTEAIAHPAPVHLRGHSGGWDDEPAARGPGSGGRSVGPGPEVSLLRRESSERSGAVEKTRGDDEEGEREEEEERRQA